MRVETKCTQCPNKISFWSWSEDRVRLAMDKGEILEFTCKNCGAKDKYHVNRFRAEPNKYLLLGALLVLLIGTPIIAYYVYEYLYKTNWSYSIHVLALVIVVPVTAYGLLLKDDRTKRNAFNWSSLKEEY